MDLIIQKNCRTGIVTHESVRFILIRSGLSGSNAGCWLGVTSALLCTTHFRLSTVFTGKQRADLTMLLHAIQLSDSQADSSCEPKRCGGALNYLVHTFSGICTKRTRQAAVLHLSLPAQLDLASMATGLPKSCQEGVHEYGIKLQAHLVFSFDSVGSRRTAIDQVSSKPGGSGGRRFSSLWGPNKIKADMWIECVFVVPSEPSWFSLSRNQTERVFVMFNGEPQRWLLACECGRSYVVLRVGTVLKSCCVAIYMIKDKYTTRI